MTVLAVFRSRAHTLDYIAKLREAGVPVQAVSTPREAGVGCGISARFDESFLPRARHLLKMRGYSSFSGFFKNSRYL